MRQPEDVEEFVVADLFGIEIDLNDFRVTGGWAGLYPLTPDTRPIVGPTPGIDGLYQALGGGGVGVQISPAIGAIVADLIATGETEVMPDWERYRLDRFDSGGVPTPSSTR